MRFVTGLSEQNLDDLYMNQDNEILDFELTNGDKKNIKPKLKYFDGGYEPSNEHHQG